MDTTASRRLLAREVKRVLAESGWTQQEAATAMGVVREQVARWATKGTIPLHRLATLAERSGVPVVIELGTTKEAASPSEWGKRLREDATLISDLLEELAEHRALAAAAAASRLAVAESADDPLADGRDAPRRPGTPGQ